jgi:hypothetical protein
MQTEVSKIINKETILDLKLKLKSSILQRLT